MPAVSPHEGSASVGVVRALVAVSELDLLYADRYLERAETKLAPLCSRERFQALRVEGERLGRLATMLRQATDRGDWSLVQGLAREAAELRAKLGGSDELVSLAAAIYPTGGLRVGTAALALNRIIERPEASVEVERRALVEHLDYVVAADPEWAPFYRERLAHFGRQGGAGHREERQVDPTNLRRAILQAVEHGDFAAVERLALTVETGRGPTASGPARVRVVGRGGADLATPLSSTTLRCAADLGLAPETLPADLALERCIASLAAAEDPSAPPPPADEATAGGRPRCVRPCPPDMRPALWESLSGLLRQPFVSSAGSRYVPSFAAEQMLVETFPETEPDARSPLLQLLGLPRRRGVPRVVIEDAIRRGTSAVCRALGLDPFEFTVACIPFDAYLRLAARHGWGRQTLWTHFDGYQLTRDLHLRALVGGDVRYGGPDDLCSVGREYDSEHLTTRLVVLRRRRFAPAGGVVEVAA